MDYKLSVEAENDLVKIWSYTFETWTIEQAERYINQIFEEIEYLTVKPEILHQSMDIENRLK